jgi:CheY-like chemotaxis protein
VKAGNAVQILVVEDSAAQRLVLCRMLQSLGHQVVQAADAITALTIASGQAFDAVLTDIALPGMTGGALMQALCAQGGPTSDALMIGITAGVDGVTGADTVLRKPVSKQFLVQVLAGTAQTAVAPGTMLLDRAQIAQLQADLGGEQVKTLIRRFMAEADVVCAQKAPDMLALHHLAGSAGLFGARALHAALLAGAWQTVWPATRSALLTLLDQAA